LKTIITDYLTPEMDGTTRLYLLQPVNKRK